MMAMSTDWWCLQYRPVLVLPTGQLMVLAQNANEVVSPIAHAPLGIRRYMWFGKNRSAAKGTAQSGANAHVAPTARIA